MRDVLFQGHADFLEQLHDIAIWTHSGNPKVADFRIIILGEWHSMWFDE